MDKNPSRTATSVSTIGHCCELLNMVKVTGSGISRLSHPAKFGKYEKYGAQENCNLQVCPQSVSKTNTDHYLYSYYLIIIIFQVEIRSSTLMLFFRPGSVHNGSAS